MLKDIVIVGSGGFAKEVAFLIEEINKKQNRWRLLGFIDSKTAFQNTKYKVVQNDEWLINTKEKISVAIGIGNVNITKKLFEQFKMNENINFPNLIHPNVIGDWERISLGIGNVICAGSVLTTDIEIGSFNVFNISCTIGHDAIINNYNIISPGANISGGVHINDLVMVGTGAQVLQNLTITSNTVIGASSLVIKSIKESGTYVGLPAKKL